MEALYREEFPRMVKYAARMLGHEDAAQELVQESFRVLWENVGELVYHPNIRGWLRQTLKNKMMNYWTAGRTNLRRFVTYDEEKLQIPGGQSPEEICTRLTEKEILQVARERLSEKNYRHLVRLTVDGASHATVAKEFGITVIASEKRLERSRRALKREIYGSERKNKKIFQKICQLLMLTEIHR